MRFVLTLILLVASFAGYSQSTFLAGSSANGGPAVTIPANTYAAFGAAINATNAPQVFNIVNFGAVGDDTTDCTLAISNAIAAAIAVRGVVYFPHASGMYKTTQVIYVQPDGSSQTYVTLMGDVNRGSMIDSQITYAGELRTNGCFCFYGAQAASYVEIANIGFNNQFSGLASLFFQYPTFHIHDCSFGVLGSSSIAGIIVGGTNSLPTGYISSVDHCYFSGSTNAIRIQSEVNGFSFDHNFVAGTAIGSWAAVVVDSSTAVNQYDQYDNLDYNTIEMLHCTNAIYLNAAQNCRASHNGMDDTAASISTNAFYFDTNTIACSDTDNTINTIGGAGMAMWYDASFNPYQGFGVKYVGNKHDEGPPWMTKLSFFGSIQAPFFDVNTNWGLTAPPATSGFGRMWNSNNVLYWVTTLHTNYICGP